MTIKTKADLIAAMTEHPSELLWWSITPTSSMKGIYTFNGSTVLARVADQVLKTDLMLELKRKASWNCRAWRFLGTD